MDDVIPGVKEAYSLTRQGEAFPIITHEFDPGRTDMDIKSAYGRSRYMDSRYWGRTETIRPLEYLHLRA